MLSISELIFYRLLCHPMHSSLFRYNGFFLISRKEYLSSWEIQYMESVEKRRKIY